MDVTIALDAMGGDHGPTEIIPSALHVLSKHNNLHLVLVGQEEILSKVLAENNAVPNEQISIKHASETVEMQELPSRALRKKKDSSMRVAINMVQDGEAQACVSAGNTGALMAISRFVLKMLPGIDRPAICSTMPALERHTHLLDLGANVDSSSEQLLQFALMGSELASAAEDIDNPTVALLNIGSEEMKGNDRVKLAATLLTDSHLNYVGFAEGTDIYSGKFDVIVCDGFVGNIALKASEGVAELMSQHAKNAFQKSFYGRLAAIVTMPVLKEIRRKLDPRRYNGASLLGLRGIVVKSHGSADKLSFAHAIEEAIVEVEKNVPERISIRLEKLLAENEPD
ncbi:MAG: phosphate acyltransferase PlsX [Gammaproteobacteria bacterium]|nr:MAG: phosphate acyltransferase PlsX [Gammaproteobacteria bacterium]